MTQKLLGLFHKKEKKEKVWKTSDTHPQVVDYVDSSIKEEVLPNGRIGMMMCPGRYKKTWRREIDKDLERMKSEYKVNVVITLVRTAELEKMKTGTGGADNFFKRLDEEEMSCRHYPIKDKWLPKSSFELCETVVYIVDELQNGKNIAVHCNGGKGRSGLIIACTLVSRGVDPKKAIQTVKKTRGGTLKNPLQQAYIYKYPKTWKKFLNGKLKKPKAKKIEDVPDEEEEIEGDGEMKTPMTPTTGNFQDKRLEQLKSMKDINKTI